MFRKTLKTLKHRITYKHLHLLVQSDDESLTAESVLCFHRKTKRPADPLLRIGEDVYSIPTVCRTPGHDHEALPLEPHMHRAMNYEARVREIGELLTALRGADSMTMTACLVDYIEQTKGQLVGEINV